VHFSLITLKGNGKLKGGNSRLSGRQPPVAISVLGRAGEGGGQKIGGLTVLKVSKGIEDFLE
jgi:hypothetical protein